jgi:hypothetical protein
MGQRKYLLEYQEIEDGGHVSDRTVHIMSDDLEWSWRQYIRGKSIVNDYFKILEINDRKVSYD